MNIGRASGYPIDIGQASGFPVEYWSGFLLSWWILVGHLAILLILVRLPAILMNI